MPFRHLFLATGAVSVLALAAAPVPARAADRATPEEVITKVRTAARELATEKEAGLTVYRGKNDRSVWKDSYVFVLDCATGAPITAAHPILAGNVGQPVTDLVTHGPKPAAEIGAEMCGAAAVPAGAWIEYNYPSPGATEATRKVSYITGITGTTWVVGAGLNDDAAQLDALNTLAGTLK